MLLTRASQATAQASVSAALPVTLYPLRLCLTVESEEHAECVTESVHHHLCSTSDGPRTSAAACRPHLSHLCPVAIVP